LQAWLTSDFYCTPAQQNGYNQNHGCLHCTHCSLPSSLLLLLTPSNFTSLLLQSPSSYVEDLTGSEMCFFQDKGSATTNQNHLPSLSSAIDMVVVVF
jgi:hypothetical protein